MTQILGQPCGFQVSGAASHSELRQLAGPATDGVLGDVHDDSSVFPGRPPTPGDAAAPRSSSPRRPSPRRQPLPPLPQASAAAEDEPGWARARSHCRFVPPLIHFIPDSLTQSVPLFLKRQCDRTLGWALRAQGIKPRESVRDELPKGELPIAEGYKLIQVMPTQLVTLALR